MKLSIIILLPLIFLGCNNAVEKTKELNKKNIKTISKDSHEERILKLNNQKEINLEKLKKDNSIQIAKIEAQKEQKLKEIELKIEEKKQQTSLVKAKLEANKSVEIANIQNASKVKIKQEENSLYQVAIIIISIVIAIFAILKYLSNQAKRKHEINLKEKEQQHQAYMQELKLKHENINKMLDILKDEKSDKELKKSITKLLEKGKGNFIEYKH